jgi:membrane-associated phospholipid phosphatase
MVYKVLKNNLFFLIPYLISLLIITPFLFLFSKSEIHQWLNQFHSAFFDWLFRYITFLGNGMFLIVPGILLLFFSLRSTAYLFSAFLSTGLFVQLLKRFFFGNFQRPVSYFNHVTQLHLVDGVPMLSGHSFPSGHAATAFALFLCLAVVGRNRPVQFLCFVIACMVAYSRVYLSQHFLVDIIVGSLIGTTGTLAFYPVFFGRDLRWHNWSLKNLIRHE